MSSCKPMGRDSEIPGDRASAGAECLLQDTKLLQCDFFYDFGPLSLLSLASSLPFLTQLSLDNSLFRSDMIQMKDVWLVRACNIPKAGDYGVPNPGTPLVYSTLSLLFKDYYSVRAAFRGRLIITKQEIIIMIG